MRTRRVGVNSTSIRMVACLRCHALTPVTGARSARKGLARDCSHREPRWCWFPEFDPIHAGRFRAGCSNYSSPLRLPISPPGHSGARIVRHAPAGRAGTCAAGVGRRGGLWVVPQRRMRHACTRLGRTPGKRRSEIRSRAGRRSEQPKRGGSLNRRTSEQANERRIARRVQGTSTHGAKPLNLRDSRASYAPTGTKSNCLPTPSLAWGRPSRDLGSRSCKRRTCICGAGIGMSCRG